jgi:RNA polymerase sigma factor (sigma-70 family)
MMADPHGLRPLLARVLADPRRETDHEAWDELLVRLRVLVRGLLLVRVRQELDASDLTQEVEHRILRHFGGFRGTDVPALLAWVGAIAASVLADYRRARPAPDPLPETDLPAPAADPGFDPELTGRVLRGVDQLPQPGRRIVTAFYLEGRTCEEIAREFGRTAVWVRVTKLHAVRRLRTLFGERT